TFNKTRWFHFVLIDLDDTLSIHAQNDDVLLRLRLRTGWRWLGDCGVQAGACSRADGHEDHEQDEQNVDEWGHIDVGFRQYPPSFSLHGRSVRVLRFTLTDSKGT